MTTPRTSPGGRRAARPLAVAATGLLALSTTALAAPAASAELPVEIDILNITDFHGRLETSNEVGGAAVLAGAVSSFRQDNPNTIVTSSGDNIGASTFTSFIQQDEPTLHALATIGLDASAIGNHELDGGRADLQERVIPYLEGTGNPFPYLAVNLYDTTTGSPAFDEFEVIEVEGVRVAFVGAVTEELPALVSPSGIATLDVRPIVPEVERVSAALTDGDEANGEADVVIALVHEGAASSDPAAVTDSSVFGEIVTGLADDVDAIFGGHSHLSFSHTTALTGRSGLPLVVAQSGEYSEGLGHLQLAVDPTTKALLSASAEILPLRTSARVDGRTVWSSAYPADPEVEAIVADAVAIATELGKEPVGAITGDLNRARQSDGGENRGGESPLGNFVAEVQRWATGAQIAFMNPGGLRADLAFAAGEGDTNAEGVVTFQEAAAVQPFANTLVTMTLTGAQLRAVLEQQWQPSGASRPFLKLGVSDGFEYTYDPAAPAGSRIQDMFLDGEIVADDAAFTVAANSFLASGGDNFGVFAEGTARADSGEVDLESQVAYFEEFGAVEPPYDQRAVGVGLEGRAVAQGQTLTLNLSSLLFSAGEPNPATVEVLLGDRVVGTSAIDAAIVDTTDEVGRAAVTVTIPADAAPGATALTVVTSAGTSIDVPITVAAATPGAPGGEQPGNGNGNGAGNDNGAGNGNGNGAGSGNGSNAVSAPKNSLANTGADADLATTGALVALAALVAGVTLVVARRRSAAAGSSEQ